jgi:hypothetical protein
MDLMTDQDADRLRERIAHDQTRCRCGHLLAACADCRDWLIANSPRIATAWEWWFIRAIEHGDPIGTAWGADAAEADNLEFYLSWRWSQ